MKHLKTFEDNYYDNYQTNKKTFKFNKGDYVKVISSILDYNRRSYENQIFQIEGVDQSSVWRYTLGDWKKDILAKEEEIILATPEEIEKYIIEQDTKKYNI